jgi:Flp pilus assembly CpaF family ATPase
MNDPLFCNDRQCDGAVQQLINALVAPLRDPAVQETSANYNRAAGLCEVVIDCGVGPMQPTGAAIEPAAIIAAVRILASSAGLSLHRDAPFLTMTMANGFRLHAVLPPSSDGPSLSIRSHHRPDWQPSDFMPPDQIERMKAAIIDRNTILIAGATSSGKTSCANALIGLIPPSERLLVIEDAMELIIRPGNVTRRIATAAADLRRHVIESLRDRPDRIIVGEVRGPEARDMLEAAATGHPGLSTIHANGPAEALTRLARLADCGQELIREAIDLVLFIERMPDGQRAVTQIKEVE